MKIQGLAVIAIIIILPMSIILNSYSQSQIKTLSLQTQYDSKLENATYDAIKAFQLNMSNSSTSDLANSKMRDISASVNTFYNSLSSHFSMYGYGKEVLQNYVPAIVYTLYDGYYIYSSYENKLDSEEKFDENASYKNGEKIYGLKPYIYYSCRYQPNSKSDFVITYSLDSYITIQGKINDNPINESGYLLTGVNKTPEGNYTYRGVEIVEENNKEGLQQYVYVENEKKRVGNDDHYYYDYIEGKNSSYGEQSVKVDDVEIGKILKYPCKKINGVKYYQENEGNIFSIINDVKYNQTEAEGIVNNKNGIKYYEDAYNFRKNVIEANDVLMKLKASQAVDSNGRLYSDYGESNPFYDYEIFKELEGGNSYIEDSDSNFNAHKLQVIQNSIESNLIPAISNYNRVSTSEVNFAMPKLKDYEWEELTQNICMITFLQGLNIGGKIYNGYSIVPNNNNEDYVSEDSIYILDQNKEYHRVTEQELLSTIGEDSVGVLNVDFERRMTTVTNENTHKSTTIYFYPKRDMASYNSIININNNNKNVYEYLEEASSRPSSDNLYKLAQIYYTALGRERYGMYRVTNKLEDVQELFRLD